MTLGKVCRKILICSSVIFLIFQSSVCAKRVTYNNTSMSSLADTRGAGNANTNVKANETGDILEVDANSNKFKKGYYSSVVYKVINKNWSDYGTFQFNINNKSKGEILMNFVSQLKDGTSLTVGSNSFVMLKDNKSNVIKRVRLTYGTFEIPKGFSGMVYVPLSNLVKQGDMSGAECNLSRVVSFGLLVSMQENQEKNFEISQTSLLEKSGEIYDDGKIDFALEGDSDVQIPVLGESIATYKIGTNDPVMKQNMSNIKFKLDRNVEGIKLTSKGRLIVSPSVKPQSINVIVFIKDNLTEIKTITLNKSWTLNIKGRSIPNPSTVPDLLSGVYGFILNENTINFIRIALVIIALAFGATIMFWRKKYANNEQ